MTTQDSATHGILNLPDEVLVVDVGPRDGLQTEKHAVSTEEKVRLINGLAHAGVRRMEATSFVSPKAVPQMADAAAVMARIARAPGVEYAALVPNVRGLQNAIAAKADLVNVVVVATETFNQRNARMSVAESMVSTQEILAIAAKAKMPVSAVLGAAFFCPFEGRTPLERVLELAGQFSDLGIVEFTLADTVGAGLPEQVAEYTHEVKQRWPHLKLGLHLHDTRGLGLANALAGLQAGTVRLEASVGGVGGCPYAPNATGNAVTEDLVCMLEYMGVKTGIDLEALMAVSRQMGDAVGHELPSRMLKAGPPELAASPA